MNGDITVHVKSIADGLA